MSFASRSDVSKRCIGVITGWRYGGPRMFESSCTALCESGAELLWAEKCSCGLRTALCLCLGHVRSVVVVLDEVVAGALEFV